MYIPTGGLALEPSDGICNACVTTIEKEEMGSVDFSGA
jgi:hypothetical protein